MSDEAPPIASELIAKLTLVDRRTASANALDAARDRAERYEAAAMGSRPADDEAAQRLLDEKRAAGATLPGLRRAFAEAGREQDEDVRGKRQGQLLGQASSLYRIDPAAALAAGHALAAPGTAGDEAAFLAHSLSGAGTDEAAHALADALGADDATADARLHAAMGLARSGVADAHTVDALRAAASSDDPTLRGAATLALGAQARTLGAGAGGPDPVADLLAQYAAASDDDTRRLVIQALGNAGDPRALDVIRGALQSPALAPAAAYALRFVPGAEVDALLHQIATTAPSSTVRRAAFAAAYYRDATLWMPWLESALAAEKSDEVKAAIQADLARSGAVAAK